ncbi:acetyl esterase [Rhodoferax lithotrophicus]|uniref:Acetyl esterase n=1 Tax=Rhodoferax lithotrophicus TaxID=2798804 RepID=A0ABM7MN71_9BURK|nr:acetyl esterase [Rhodoferax sp. MIZ03]
MPHRNPRTLLTPAMHGILERMARAGQMPLHALTPSQARAAYEVNAGVLDLPPTKLERVESFTVPTRDGFDLPVRLYAPSSEPLPVLVYLHGGGFTIGSIATHDVLCRHLSHLAHCAVLSVGYRLAPEHRFPTAFEDAWDAVHWVATLGHEKGLENSRIAVGGDSAGGTLAAACALQARDLGVDLKLQLLFYPGTTAHADTPSHKTFAHGFVLEAAHIDYFFDFYIPNRQDREDWRFAPLLAHDADGVAPAWFGLAECDPLVDEGLAYADKLRAAGVAVDLEIYRGVTHEFIKMGRAIPEAGRAHADAARALRQAFETHPVGQATTESLTVSVGDWARLGEAARAVRLAVFVQEQQIPLALEQDQADARAVHVLVLNPQGKPMATGRLLQVAPGVGQIGRLAVIREHRGKGLGQLALKALVDAAAQRGDHEVRLHAQASAKSFYAALGFVPQGEPFVEAGIVHTEMLKSSSAR